MTCYTTVCRDCLVIKHPRSEHEIEELKNIVKTWKGEMTKKLDRLNEEVQKNAANEKKLDEIQAQIESAQKLAESKIDERAREIITQVEARREEMKRQIQEASQQNLKKIQEERNHIADRGKRLRNIHSATQQIVDTAADHVYMKEHAALVDKMEKLCDAKHEMPTFDKVCLHFNTGSNQVNSTWFGKVFENDHEVGKATLITKSGSFKQAQSIAATQSRLLAVVDSDTKEVIVYCNDSGKYKPQVCLGDSSDDSKVRLARPRSVAVTSGDKLFVIDGPVKAFSATGKAKKRKLLYWRNGPNKNRVGR